MPASVLVIVDSPNNSRVIQEGQAPTTMAAWSVPVEDGTTIDDAVTEWALELIQRSQLPAASTLKYVDEADASTKVVALYLEDDEA